MTERVLIVGGGHVGRGLYRAFRNSGVELLGLHGRRASASITSWGALPDSIANANTIIVAVQDDLIDDALEQLVAERRLGNRSRIASGTVVVHTSGSADPSLVPQLSEHGLSGGTFHPLVPFANPESAADLLKRAWIGIDGDEQAKATSRRLAGHLGARTLEIPAGGKSVYHAAAVMSSNFPVVLAAYAARMLEGLGIPERSAHQAVHSLMDAALANLGEKQPHEVLTGPISRGDADTVLRHLAALRPDPDARALYKRLSLAALWVAEQQGVDRSKLDEIQSLLILR